MSRQDGMGASLGAWLRREIRGLSGIGLALGSLFFAATLTPSLIPRTFMAQGVLGGLCLAIGYGLGALWRGLWAYMELPEPAERLRRIANSIVALVCLVIVVLFLSRAAEWQNSIRTLMRMPPLDSAHPTKLCAVALATFAALLALGRLFRWGGGYLAARVGRIAPRRVANVVGFAGALLLVWLLANGVIYRFAIHVLDGSYQARDALMEPERRQPDAPEKTGSAASLVRWRDLGRAGREFVASGPSAAEIEAVAGGPVREPIRVYVGLGSAETPRARARLALREMQRVGAFDRKVLVVITPTGTGWVDPAAMDTVEYLHRGDIASVAVQYSYLSSPLSLLVQPEFGGETARALFSEVYRYWTSLPKEHRPKLYLHGLSLGAMNSEKSAELFEILGDPVDGALWSGPPFGSRIWRSITQSRNEGSPAWLPEFRDGRLVRFMNQDGTRVPADTPWGVMRVVYLQYASDAVTFFSYGDFFRRPAWLNPPRGPDVSPQLRWYPVVTALQIAVDMAVAATTPIGYGHVYAPRHYLEGWVAVTSPPGWSEEALGRLKEHLARTVRAPRGSFQGGESAYSNRGG